MANQNGMGGANNTAMYGGGMNGPVMPSAGHYSDMQTLMQNMEQLSGWLAQNREDWQQVQDGLARVERLRGRSVREGHELPNGDAPPDQDSPTKIQLQAALSTANNRIASLQQTYQDHLRLQQLYEDTLSEATARIRQYCFEQQQYMIELHQHYTTLLSQSRNETIEAQLTHQAWQSSLKRVSEGMREALKAREEEGKPWKKRIAALKEENRVLRLKVGWEAVGDSDEEEEGVKEEVRGRVGSGQGE